MNKTPVSILQEMMVKKQIVPQYDLIHDGGGTHINTFIYQVICDGLCATGQGRCKKDAKHEAAKAMIQAIAAVRNYPQLPASAESSPVNTSSPAVDLPSKTNSSNAPFLNAVGALQDLCYENMLGEPEYNLISDVGPPHARIFTMQCVVATFKEEGVATTKKQAKQEASKKMLERIQEIIGDARYKDELSMKHSEISTKELIAFEIVKARYPTLNKLNVTRKNLGSKISQYHIEIRNQFDEETRTELIRNLESVVSAASEYSSVKDTESLLTKVDDCLAPSNLKLTIATLPCEDAIYVAAGKISTCPDIVEIESGTLEDKVKFDVTLKVLTTMLFFLQ